MSSRTPSRRERERGIALAIALFGIALLSIVLAASLLVGSSDARATRNYRRTSQVHLVAEAGIANGGYFKSTANGPEGATNTVVANVTRSVIPSTAPGALHLANAGATDAQFNGNAFSISGNDM